jgi:Tol biopolymer transport system component/DNA-binding winged helix-turn-helix (wHTH) protein
VAPAPANIVRFGPFEADFQKGELRKHGLRIRIQDQPMLVLSALVARPGEVISREDLQQRLWPGVAYLDFEHGLNMAVKKLRAALGDSAEHPRYVETLARKGYRFVASVESGSAAAVVSKAGGQKHRLRVAGIFAVAGLTVSGAALLVLRQGATAPPRITSLVSASGPIGALCFSPDGKEVAYQLGEAGGPRIFLKTSGFGSPRRLTDDTDQTHREFAPLWIPDGSGISFLRRETSQAATLFTVPVSGGTPRKLLDLGVCRGYTWTPDSRFILAALVEPDGLGSIYKLSVPNGARQRITSPTKVLSNTMIGLSGDGYPQCSLDGKRIAFVRWLGNGPVLMVAPADGGAAKEVVHSGSLPDDPGLFAYPSFGWTAGTREMVFLGNGQASFFSLYRVDASGGEPSAIAAVPPAAGIGHMAIAPGGGRMAYILQFPRSTIWRYALRSEHEGPAASAVSQSPRMQSEPDYSPDGRRFAFASNRSGNWEIFTADRDGRNPMQLTSFNRGMTGWGRWSPDGRRIVLDARPAGRAQVFVVDAEGGTPKLLAADAGEAVMPAWSTDGAWVFYTLLDATGHSDIWKVPAEGGPSRRVTSMDAYGCFPSLDGTTLYVSTRSAGVYAVPLAGGAPEPIAELRNTGAGVIAVGRSGIYFVAPASGDRSLRQLMHYSFSTRKAERLLLLPQPVQMPALAVSRDETEILVAENDGIESQVILVENFR